MKIQALSTAVHDFIGEGKTGEALELLKKEIPAVYPKGLIDVTLFKSRYVQAHDDFAIRGVISSADFDARVSQLNLSILEFLERIGKKEEATAPTAEGYTVAAKKAVKHALKISTPGLVILFSRKGLIGFGAILALGFGVKHFYFNNKPIVEEKKMEVIDAKAIPVPNDTALLQAKLKAFERAEAEEERNVVEQARLNRRKNMLNRIKETKDLSVIEKEKKRSKRIKKPSTYSNEMDTLKPVYAPAQKKILFPNKPVGNQKKA